MRSLTCLICIQLFVIQAVYSQCVVQGPNGPIELLPNQVLLPPGVPYIGQVPGQPGRQVYIPAPNPPCPSAQPVIVPPPPIPTEYVSSLPPVFANFAPNPNIAPGNVIVPNIPAGIPNLLPGNVIVPNIPSGIPNILPGNVIVPNIPPGVPNLLPGNVIAPNIPSGNLVVPNVIESYAPAVVHDNSVANSLANALQLLVVSSLLSNTLPEPYRAPCYDNYVPGYGYVY